VTGFVLQFCYGLSAGLISAVLLFVLLAHAKCRAQLATVESAFQPIKTKAKLTLDATLRTALKRPFSES
jgi:hypothetical protein